jgi:hypothetical protein
MIKFLPPIRLQIGLLKGTVMPGIFFYLLMILSMISHPVREVITLLILHVSLLIHIKYASICTGYNGFKKNWHKNRLVPE